MQEVSQKSMIFLVSVRRYDDSVHQERIKWHDFEYYIKGGFGVFKKGFCYRPLTSGGSGFFSSRRKEFWERFWFKQKTLQGLRKKAQAGFLLFIT